MIVGGRNDRSEEILRLGKLGYDGDGNNLPSPENIPTLPYGELTTTVEECRFDECNR